MKVFLAERPADNWEQDYAMVIIAENAERAMEKARQSSCDFKECREIVIKEIGMDKEQCVLRANTGM